MARTIEQILEVQLGKMQLVIASNMSQMEQLAEQLVALQARVKELEALTAEAPKPDGHKPTRPRLGKEEVTANG